MRLHAVKILGIKVTNSQKKDILENIEKFMAHGPRFIEKQKKNFKNTLIIVTPNPEQLVYAQKDRLFRNILNRADVAIPDGVGIVWASRMLGRREPGAGYQTIRGRIPGVELMGDLTAMAAKRGVTIGLIGGRGDLAVKALECLRRNYPGLRGVALGAPEFTLHNGELISAHSDNLDMYFQTVARTIAQNGVKIVFVGLGAPKQELFIERLNREMSFRPPSRNPVNNGWIPGQARDDKGIVFMSVGGSFDIITGRTPRAPKWVRSLGIEWLWRLLREPWRLGRQLALLKFVWLVVWERFSRK